MKIKHFQGYGCLEAKVVKKTLNTATSTCGCEVKVKGNHEYGLDCTFGKRDTVSWLNKVIKDNYLSKALSLSGFESYNFWNKVKVDFEYLPDEDGVECALYKISYQY